MRNITLVVAVALMLATASSLSAQPQGFGGPRDGRGPAGERWGAARLESFVEDLDLTDDQSAKWQATIDRHIQSREERRKQIAELREEFNTLAETENPNLERLGEIALILHREARDTRLDRQQLLTELKAILTPEQSERFDSLMASRQFARPRERFPRQERSGREPDQQ